RCGRRHVIAFPILTASDDRSQRGDLLATAASGDVPIDDLVRRWRLRRGGNCREGRHGGQEISPHQNSSFSLSGNRVSRRRKLEKSKAGRRWSGRQTRTHRAGASPSSPLDVIGGKRLGAGRS